MKLSYYSKLFYKKEKCWKFFSCCNHTECFLLQCSPVKVSCLYKADLPPRSTFAASHLSQLHPGYPFCFLTDLMTGVSPALHSLQILGFVGCFPCFEGAENNLEPVKQTCPVPLCRKCSHVPYLFLLIGVTSLPVSPQIVLPR